MLTGKRFSSQTPSQKTSITVWFYALPASAYHELGFIVQSSVKIYLHEDVEANSTAP